MGSGEKFTATPSENGVIIRLIGGPYKLDIQEYITNDAELIHKIINNPETTREYFFRSCGVSLARSFWENPNLPTEEKPDMDALSDMLYGNNLMIDYHNIMSEADYREVENGFAEYIENELVTVSYDEENVAEEFWGEIFARAKDGDRIAKILADNDNYLCTKSEAREIYEYAIRVPGYFSGDEKAPEALIRREQVMDDEQQEDYFSNSR